MIFSPLHSGNHAKNTKNGFLQKIQASERWGGGLLLGKYWTNININYITMIAIQTSILPFFIIASAVYIEKIIADLKKSCIPHFGL